MTVDRVRLVITRGLPGSGKTTRAVAWVADDPQRRARLNRDMYRTMMFGGFIPGARWAEEAVTVAQHAGVAALLRNRFSVVVDDTLLNPAHVTALIGVAARLGARHELWDLTDVPLATCIERDAHRPEPVGADVIRRMHDRWIAPTGSR